MTKEELKQQEPALYNQIFEAGQEAGREAGKNESIEAERARVTAWLDFYDGDVEAAIKPIEEGKGPDFADALKEDVKTLLNRMN